MRRKQLRAKYGDDLQADRAQMREALGKIHDHFPGYLAWTLPLLYRGIQFNENETGVNLFFFALFTAGLILSFCRNDIGVFAVLYAAAFMYAFHAMFTHSIPRYNLPLYAVSFAGAMYSVNVLVSTINAARRQRTERRDEDTV
ncbi:MAG: hypothetical protein JRJ47_07220 [Deltaproteobacteria bacterium]|nr:hypothetical protein [Deltaproteobacteria bacterium]